MQDRIVEFPNRYRLVKVAGTEDTFDLIPAPGEVIQEGTPLNMGTLLKHDTAAGLNLDETAVPDEALQKLTGAFRTFRDEESGQLYSVETEISTWGARETTLFSDLTPLSMFRYKNRLLVVGDGSYSDASGYNPRDIVRIYDLTTGSAIASQNFGYDEEYGHAGITGNPTSVSVDGSAAVVWLSGGYNRVLVDMEYGIMHSVGASYLSKVLITKDYWGLVTYSDGNYAISYAPRGSTTFTGLGVGYQTAVVGISGNTVWLIGRTGNNTTYQLHKADLSTGKFTSAVKSWDFTNIGVSASYADIYPSLMDDTHAYLAIRLTFGNVEYWSTRVLKLNLLDGSDNFSDLKWSEFTNNTQHGSFRTDSYAGSAKGKAYFATSGAYAGLLKLNKETGLLTWSQLKSAFGNMGTKGELKEVVFQIPQAEEIVMTNGVWINTDTKTMSPIAAYIIPYFSSNSSNYDVHAAYKLATTAMYFGGTVTDADIVGAIDRSAIVGGTITRQITRLVPVDPLA